MSTYVDQSASGLRFYLISEAVDVSPFVVIKTTEFQWNHQQIEMGILGASHFLRIDRGEGRHLSEIFACAEMDFSTSFIKSAPFLDLPAQVQVEQGGVRYRFVPRLMSWGNGAERLASLRERIAHAIPSQRTWGLEHEFPRLPGTPENTPPLTLMWARVGGQFTLETAHCYPNDGQIVFTTTTLSKTKG